MLPCISPTGDDNRSEGSDLSEQHGEVVLLFGDIATTRSVNLWEAVAAGNAHAIQKEKSKALEARNEHGDTLLHLAAARGHAAVVAEFLRDSALKELLSVVNAYSESPLHVACAEGRSEVVQQLIAAGADVNTENQHGDTPMYAACYGGHVGVVQVLLGVPNVRYKESGKGHLSPQAVARSRGFEAVVTVLQAHTQRLQPGHVSPERQAAVI